MTATPGVSSVVLSWWYGDWTPDGFVVSTSTNGSPVKTETVGDVRSTVVSGLTNGVTYDFSVAAVTSQGTSPATASNPMTAGAPNPVGTPFARFDRYPTGGVLEVTWQPATPNAAMVSQYNLEVYVDGVFVEFLPLGSNLARWTTPCYTTGAYTFRVAPVNMFGTGPYTPPSFPFTPSREGPPKVAPPCAGLATEAVPEAPQAVPTTSTPSVGALPPSPAAPVASTPNLTG